jgi:hypothetical protein
MSCIVYYIIIIIISLTGIFALLTTNYLFIYDLCADTLGFILTPNTVPLLSVFLIAFYCIICVFSWLASFSVLVCN